MLAGGGEGEDLVVTHLAGPDEVCRRTLDDRAACKVSRVDQCAVIPLPAHRATVLICAGPVADRASITADFS